jgi:cysteine desulfurase
MGIGVLYVKNSVQASPLIYGVSKERLLRAGTENVTGIVGLAKALEIAYTNLDIYQKHIDNLKRCCIDRLKSNIPDMKI